MTEYTLEKRYLIFLKFFQKELGKMFTNQAEFIKCKEGCSYCCEKGEYPFSELEFDYLMEGYKKLDNETKAKILFNIAKVNEKMANHKTGTFMYDCPFLIDHRCSVYENRGIICRTFGLLSEHDDGKFTMPFCHEYGLNYSNVYNKEKGQIVTTTDDGKPLCKTEPKAYRIQRSHVLNLSIAKDLDLDWGDSKTLIDFLNESNITDL